MIHLFTKGNSLLSKTIRAATREPVSHYAQLYPKTGIIIHSNLIGVHPDFDTAFLKGSEIVFFKEVSISLEAEVEAIRFMRDQIGGKSYDFGALAYQGVAVARNRYFGTTMPTVNEWENRSALLCTEVYDSSPDFIVETFPELENLTMVTPYQIARAIGAEPYAGQALIA